MLKNKSKLLLINICILITTILTSCNSIESKSNSSNTNANSSTVFASKQDIPEYSGESYVILNDNQPDFSDDELTTTSYESYSDLDSLGRCGVAEANIGQDLMPTEERGAIGQVKPTGWHTIKYDNVDGKYLYNRCHLIGYQLTAENANEKNLITGTRYLNVTGMLPYEDTVADYVKKTDNHVLYRVTPIFEGDNLVASGVQMEAKSVEDNGKGVCFNVYVYNVQPGITINYATGESFESKDDITDSISNNDVSGETYIINKNTHKFHKPDCSSVSDIKPQNRKEYTGNREDLMNQGYDPCSRCNP